MAKDKLKVRVSTISGGSVINILRIFKENKIETSYIPRALTSLALSLVAEPFRLFEHLRYDALINDFEIEKPPIFILGHWRSGTTYLHNLMCEDPNIGFVSTYQGIFPELLGSGWLFKTFMKAAMPEKRASDNVVLSADYPQEEEFALGNMNPFGFYNFWFFPRRTRQYYEQSVEFKGMSQDQINRWKSDYLRLAKKALIFTKRKRFISKNPPHTGRIKQLLEIFPNAKFIHIYRNPVTVFISTKKLIESTMPSVQFQNISSEEVEKNIFWMYERMMQSFLADKKLIPSGNLVEVKFEEFESNTLPELERIYNILDLDDLEIASKKFSQYIQLQRSYQKNKYKVSKGLVDKITKRWKFAMDEWNYDLPENLELVAG